MSIHVLIADNSTNIDILEKSVLSDAQIQVVAKVRSGRAIISYCTKVRVDVIVVTTALSDMDIDKMIRQLYRKKHVPILILQEKEADPEFFNRIGIIDVLVVTYKNNHLDVSEVSLITRVQILSRLNLMHFSDNIEHELGTSQVNNENSMIGRIKKPKLVKKEIPSSPLSKQLVVIGASTGGPKLLAKLIPKLPSSIPPVLVVQHIPEGFIENFTKRIDNRSAVRVKMAKNGEPLQGGTVYVAPGGNHLRLKSRGAMHARIEVFDDKPVNFVKPSVDVALFSAAPIYKSQLVSVVLTGMGKDGLEGCRLVKKHGGWVIALNEADSDIYGMNKEIVDAGLADRVLPANRLVGGILDILRGINIT